MSIADLKTSLGSGARPNKYKISLTLPSAVTGLSNSEEMNTLAKATSLPGKTIGTIDTFYRGRKIIMAGEETFDNTWTVTFYNNQSLAIRSTITSWFNCIDLFDESKPVAATPSDYTQDLMVEQLDLNNTRVAAYKLYNAFPSGIGAVELADDANDTISEFEATFTFTHWKRID